LPPFCVKGGCLGTIATRAIYGTVTEIR
jgi:hypothetical protein